MVRRGELSVGGKLPTNRELAAQLKTSVLTVQKAMKTLEASGVVACHRRKGTYLLDGEALRNPRVNTGLVGLFCPEFFNDFHADTMLELERRLSETGKLLSINFTHSRPDKELALLKTLARQRLEALVYFASPLVAGSPGVSRSVGAWIDRYLDEGTFVLFVDLAPIGYENRLISLDNIETGRLLTRELIKRGHRSIAYIGTTHLDSGRGRHEGYRLEMRAAGLPLDDDLVIQVRIIEGSETDLRVPERMEALIARHPDVTGFVVDNQESARNMHRILSREAGRRFEPGESIAGCFEESLPPFDAAAWVRIPGRRMGELAFELIRDCEYADEVHGRLLIPPVLWQPNHA